MSDWIEWAGGECPVPDRTQILVRFRFENGAGNEGDYSEGPEDLRWSHVGSWGDIVAYRLSKDEGK